MKTVAHKNDKAYLKKLNKVKKSEEYLQNEMQIDCIKNVLIKHLDVPEKLLDWLIDSVQKNDMLISDIKTD